MRSSVLVLGVVFVLIPGSAAAHFNLLAPPSSNASNATEGGKGAPPCGPDASPSTAPMAIQGGQMFTLKINETVYHPGFYRVALALHSRSELPADPAVTTAVVMGMTQSVSAVATDMAFPVLANNLFADHKALGPQQAQIKIPNVNCDKCTLQVIEFMAQHGPNPGGLYYYHHCADLKITADPSQPVFDPTAGGAGGGSSGGAAGTAGAGVAGNVGASVAGASGASAGSGGTGGGTGGSTGGGPALGIAGGGTPSTTSAGAPASAGSPASAGAGPTAAGATGATSTGDSADSGGCSMSNPAAGSKPLLSLLVGLLVLGRRRNRRR